jgi:hypothetical protein
LRFSCTSDTLLHGGSPVFSTQADHAIGQDEPPLQSSTLTGTTPDAANKVTFDGITNATASYTFTGKTISYIARKGPDQGRVKVFIDGTEQDANSSTNAVDPFELYAATEQLKQVIFTTSSLTDAQHTIRIEQDGTKDAASTGTGINLDAFRAVYAPAMSRPLLNFGGRSSILPYAASIVGATSFSGAASFSSLAS